MKSAITRHDVPRIVGTALLFVASFLASAADHRENKGKGPDQRENVSSKATAPDQAENIASIDHYVDHVSTAPALAGMNIRLYVRERIREGHLKSDRKAGNDRKVVLFVHGGTYPSVPDFDLDYKDYSWMEYLAKAGFDVFAMDITGYGKSSRPYMDDPCNVNPAQQSLIMPPLTGPCPASFPFRLTTTLSEWDDMNAVVEYIRGLTGADKVHLVGWSAGGPRVGGYAALWPEKVDKIVTLAPAYNRNAPDTSPLPLPTPGFPMNVSTRERAFNERWDIQVFCENQFEPAIRDAIWASNMEFDPVGATWGPNGVVRQRTSTGWAWNQNMASMVEHPFLLVVGEFDMEVSPRTVRNLYEDLGSDRKVLMTVACASHYLVYETQYKVLHEASKNWLLHGSIHGVKSGELTVDADGLIIKMQ